MLAGQRALDRPQQHLPAVDVPGAAAPLARRPLRRLRRQSRVPRPFFAKPTPFPSVEEEEKKDKEPPPPALAELVEEVAAAEAKQELLDLDDEDAPELPDLDGEDEEDKATKGRYSPASPSASSGSSRGRAPQDLSDFQNLPPDELVTGIVTRITKYGLHLEAVPPNGGRACSGVLHISNLKKAFVTQEELEEEFYVGQELQARVISANMEDGRLSFSMRPPAKADRARRASGGEAPEAGGAQADRADVQASMRDLAELPPGSWIKGEVKRLLPFGALVEVAPPSGGVNVKGLLHVSRMKRGYVSQEMLQSQFPEGQEVSVRISEVDLSSWKVSFSLLEPAKVDLEALKAVPQDQWFVGSILHIGAYGMMVVADVNGQDVTGMVHISQVDPLEKVGPGDEVQLRVHTVNMETERVQFSMLNMTRWNISAFEGLPSDQLLDAQITSVTSSKGAFAVVQHPSGDQSFMGRLKRSVAREELDDLEVGQKVKVLVSHLAPSGGGTRLVLPARSAPPALTDLGDMDGSEEGMTAGSSNAPGLLDDLIRTYKAQLLAQGYDSVELLKCLNAEEWTEMKQACGLRPGDAAKLRRALGRK